MPRKLKVQKPRADTVIGGRVETISTAFGQDEKGPGPSPADSPAVSPPVEIDPKTMQVPAKALLSVLAVLAKGDAATREETDLVAQGLAGVAAKYSADTRWAPEINLALGLACVAVSMRQRRQAIEEKANPATNAKPENRSKLADMPDPETLIRREDQERRRAN